jgi:hypothetical protein
MITIDEVENAEDSDLITTFRELDDLDQLDDDQSELLEAVEDELAFRGHDLEDLTGEDESEEDGEETDDLLGDDFDDEEDDEPDFA